MWQHIGEDMRFTRQRLGHIIQNNPWEYLSILSNQLTDMRKAFGTMQEVISGRCCKRDEISQGEVRLVSFMTRMEQVILWGSDVN